MKIAHIVCTYPPYYGGMGNVVFQTASHLAEMGHDVEVFTPQYSEERAKAEKFEDDFTEKKDYASRLSAPIKYGNAAYLPSISKSLNNFDIVHLHYPFFGTANLVRKWKLKNPHKPLILTYHMDTRGDGLKGFIFKLYNKFYLEKILNSADKIIASSFDYISNSDGAKLFENNPEKFLEMPFGVDIERFKPREKDIDLFNKYNLNSNLPTVLFVGGLDSAHYFKGVSVLLKALKLLQKNDKYVQAIFVGGGNLKEKYELQTRGLGLSDRIKFVGKISDENLPLYYNMADLFILPSINRGEAFGLVLLEAMASAVPVLASDLPGVRKVANDGGSVFEINNYEQLSNKIEDYLFSNVNKNLIKKNVRQIVEEKYSWKVITERLVKVYNELVDKV